MRRLIAAALALSLSAASAQQMPGGGAQMPNAAPPPFTVVTNSLGADVPLNNISNFIDGPSTAQGTVGTWLAIGGVTVGSTTAADNIVCKLWDGTNAAVDSRAVGARSSVQSNLGVSLGGTFTNPAGNIRISCKDTASTTGVMVSNQSGAGKDSTLTVVKLQ